MVPEDYFRVLKENKEIEKSLKGKKSTTAISKSRFESGFDSMQKHSPDKQDLHGISEIDPEMDDEEAIKYIELPQDTMYLIDKVVRQRMKAGPIGVDNSELINLEMEDEYKEKNHYIKNLMHGGRQERSEGTDTENKENIDNQRLLERLTVAASHIHHPNNRSKMSHASKSQIGERSTQAFSHEEWMRRKEHEVKLKEQLIREAKKDMLEQIRRKQAEEEVKRQEKHLALMQWEERKRQEEE